MKTQNLFPQLTSEINHNLFQLICGFLREKIADGLSDKTVKGYIQTFNNFHFLTVEDFERTNFIEFCAASVREFQWSKRTLVTRLRQVCAFNRWLFYRGVVRVVHRAPRMSNKPKRRELPTDTEWALFFDSLKQRYETSSLGRRKSRWRDYLVCRILHQTGVRIGEAAELRVGDLMIHDVGQYFLYIAGTKSEAAERAVILDEELTEEIRSYLWTFRIQNKAARMFTSKTGKPLDTIEFCKWVKKYCADLQIEAEVTPHVFRHNFILQFIARGESPAEVQARLGHSSSRMTEFYFNQVRRLFPFVQLNADHAAFERRAKARARFFQRKRGNDDE